MTIKHQLFNSFVKGVGKTLGTVLIFGFVGTVFYMYSNEKSNKHLKESNLDLTEKDDINTVQMSNLDNTDNTENTKNTDNTENTDNTLYENFANQHSDIISNHKYKTLFEHLLK
jgi:cbb3-type cytochrome oxidase subunit 3